MNENWLRWKARLGSSKKIAVILVIGIFVFSIPVISDLKAILKNTRGPLLTEIEQLVDETVNTDQYVKLSGYAFYGVGYDEKEYGAVSAHYYFLIDADSATAVLVKASSTDMESGWIPTKKTPHTGMIKMTPSALRTTLQADMADPFFEGLRTNPGIFLAEGETPPSILPALGKTGALAILFLLSIATFFFPRTIFSVKPVQTSNPPARGKISLPIVRATGKFVRIIQFEPKLQVSQYTKKFDGAIANIVPLEPQKLLIFIRHVVKTTLHGIITISQNETHWGVFINAENVIDIEPGKQYGWRDYWAVCFRYRSKENKENLLLVSFSSAELQNEFVKSLRESGFSVGSGINETVITM